MWCRTARSRDGRTRAATQRLDIEPAYQGTRRSKPAWFSSKIADPDISPSCPASWKAPAKAFELIVAAYAKHDTDMLKPLLSRRCLFAGFASSIQDREAGMWEPWKPSWWFCEAAEAWRSADRRRALWPRRWSPSRFQSEQVNVIRDKSGAVIEGSRDHVESVTDVWTFARDTVEPRSQLGAGSQPAASE